MLKSLKTSCNVLAKLHQSATYDVDPYIYFVNSLHIQHALERWKGAAVDFVYPLRNLT